MHYHNDKTSAYYSYICKYSISYQYIILSIHVQIVHYKKSSAFINSQINQIIGLGRFEKLNLGFE